MNFNLFIFKTNNSSTIFDEKNSKLWPPLQVFEIKNVNLTNLRALKLQNNYSVMCIRTLCVTECKNFKIES